MNLLLLLAPFLITISDLKNVMLNASDFEENIEIGNENYTKSYDVWALYNGIEVYQLPELESKEFQSFRRGSDKGNVFYFLFSDNLNEGSEVLIEKIIWNNKTSRNNNRPAKYYIKDNILVVLYFNFKSAIGSNIENIVKNKIGSNSSLPSKTH